MKSVAVLFVLSIIVTGGWAKPQDESTEPSGLSKQEMNKKIIIELYDTLFKAHDIESVDKYIIGGEGRYIQHNPWIPDGRGNLKCSVRGWFKEGPWESEILKSVAVDDYVWLHVRATSPALKKVLGGNGTVAIAEIFRLEDQKVVEHWDVIQPVSDMAANDHPYF